MYGTASLKSHEAVTRFGGIPIDYKSVDFVEEIRRLSKGSRCYARLRCRVTEK
jgi:hypothetical protein